MAITETRQYREPFVEAAGLGVTNEGLRLLGQSLPTATYTGRGFVAGQSGLESAAATAAANLGQLTGTGAGTADQAGSIASYMSPYQQEVIDASLASLQREQDKGLMSLRDSAVRSGAFGGGREGVQQAELQGRTLEAMGRAQQQGFNTALGAAQRQQQVGLAAGQQLGQLGAGQQQMAQADVNQLMAAGGVQRQLAQSALDAQRQSTLQQQYEPYQRAEFLANLYAAGPKSSSQVTMGTQPSTSPLAQAVGTGIGAFTAFQGMKPTGQA